MRDWPHIEAEVRRRTVADIRARLTAQWGHVAPGCVDPGQVQDVLDDVGPVAGLCRPQARRVRWAGVGRRG